MTAVWTSLQPIWKVLVVGLLAGAGLPAIFALGLKFLVGSTPVGESTTADVSGSSKAVAYLCFAVVFAVVVCGIIVMVHPKTFGLS